MLLARKGYRELLVDRATFPSKTETAVFANEPDTFWTDQVHNQDAVRGYMASTGSC